MEPDVDEHWRDRMALRLVVEQYARAADRRDPELFAEVFTDDAVLVTNRGEVRGRRELLAVPPRLGRYEVTAHLVANHHVVFDAADPDRATGQVSCVASHVYSEGPERRVYEMHIRYDDRYVRHHGRWRIDHRHLVLLWDEDRSLGTRSGT